MTTKTATVTVATIGLACPYCGESYTTPGHNFDWHGEELHAANIKPGTTITCDGEGGEYGCGRKFRAPAIVGRVL